MTEFSIEDFRKLGRSKNYNDALNKMIKKFDKGDWDYISEFQPLSIEFIRKHKNKLNWELLLNNHHMADELKVEFPKYIPK